MFTVIATLLLKSTSIQPLIADSTAPESSRHCSAMTASDMKCSNSVESTPDENMESSFIFDHSSVHSQMNSPPLSVIPDNPIHLNNSPRALQSPSRATLTPPFHREQSDNTAVISSAGLIPMSITSDTSSMADVAAIHTPTHAVSETACTSNTMTASTTEDLERLLVDQQPNSCPQLQHQQPIEVLPKPSQPLSPAFETCDSLSTSSAAADEDDKSGIIKQAWMAVQALSSAPCSHTLQPGVCDDDTQLGAVPIEIHSASSQDEDTMDERESAEEGCAAHYQYSLLLYQRCEYMYVHDYV